MDRTSNVLPKAKYTNAMSMASKPLSPGTNDSGIILGALALPGNPYDGHTIDVVLKQLKRVNSTRPDILIADRVYRGGNNFGKNHLLTPSRPAQDDTEYKKLKQRNRFIKRTSIEATISHSN